MGARKKVLSKDREKEESYSVPRSSSKTITEDRHFTEKILK